MTIDEQSMKIDDNQRQIDNNQLNAMKIDANS